MLALVRVIRRDNTSRRDDGLDIEHVERVLQSARNSDEFRSGLLRAMREIRAVFGEDTRFKLRLREGAVVTAHAYAPARHLDTLSSLLAEFERHRRWGEVEIDADGTLRVTIDFQISG